MARAFSDWPRRLWRGRSPAVSAAISELRQAALVNTLRSSRLFSGLPPSDLARVAAITRVKTLDRGEYLFREGQPARGFFVVQKGAISVHRLTARGREQVIHIFRAGDSFAEGALLLPTGYPADARAVELSQVLLVDKEGFLALLRREPDLGLRMLASVSHHLRVLVEQLEELTLRDVETRLANWLVKRCPSPTGNQPVCIELGMTKRTLAAELGTVSETLSRTLRRFSEQGLLTVRGGTLVVRSPAGLQALLRRNLGD